MEKIDKLVSQLTRLIDIQQKLLVELREIKSSYVKIREDLLEQLEDIKQKENLDSVEEVIELLVAIYNNRANNMYSDLTKFTIKLQKLTEEINKLTMLSYDINSKLNKKS